MELTAIQAPRVEAGTLPLESLANNSHVAEADKIAEVSRAFEAVLLRQILAESQKPVMQTAYTGNSAADGIYRDLIVTQLADDISKSGTVGLAKSLARELQFQTQARSHAAPVSLNALNAKILKPLHE